MTKGLEELKRLAYENACCRCQYHKDGECRNDKGECVWKTIEKELKDYSEIKEIAKHYHWDDFVKDTHMVDTDEKYLRLFNAAIPGIQADYRKARAFEIIVKHNVALSSLLQMEDASEYNTAWSVDEKNEITQDEFDLLKDASETAGEGNS